MKEHPIPFKDTMVRAILAGYKTQTRRVMKPDPAQIGLHWEWRTPKMSYYMPNGTPADHLLGIWDACPYGVPGDHLWVRETYGLTDASASEIYAAGRTFAYDPDSNWEDGYAAAIYRADGEWTRPNGVGSGAFRWRPSIHMWRWASRITLEVVSVRIEPLRMISELDCERELGVKPYSLGNGAVAAFIELWDSINAKRGYSWESNPWVWRIEFKRVEVPA